MPARIPLVYVNGLVAQLPAGDSLDAPVSEVDVLTLQNAVNAAVGICNAVYLSAAGAFKLARADAAATKNVLALVRDTSIAAGASGSVQTDGLLVASAAQWDAVTGGANNTGLTPGAMYYLSPTTAGGLTVTPPASTSRGQYAFSVGVAISATALDITLGKVDILL